MPPISGTSVSNHFASLQIEQSGSSITRPIPACQASHSNISCNSPHPEVPEHEDKSPGNCWMLYPNQNPNEHRSRRRHCHPSSSSNLPCDGTAVLLAYYSKNLKLWPPDTKQRLLTQFHAHPLASCQEILRFEGFFAPFWKTMLYCFFGALSGGLLLLATKWAPSFRIKICLESCELKDAEFVRIVRADGQVDLERVEVVTVKGRVGGSQPTLAVEDEEGHTGLLQWQNTHTHRLLEYRCNRYFFVEAMGKFAPVAAIPNGFNAQLQTCGYRLLAPGHASQIGDADWDLVERQLRYGANEMRIPVKSLGKLVFDEMWHPFYVFQYCSILIWVIGDQYYTYSVCIFAITWFSIISAAVETHQNLKRLANIAYFHVGVDTVRGGGIMEIDSPALVPGDIIVVKTGILPCDCVLLRGEAILDENMLTGESIPVRKVSYSPTADGLSYHPDKHPSCTLYAGTNVAQARAPRGMKVLAMVVRTGFNSSKGNLLRSILFPREHEQSFVSDSLKFIIFMLVGCMALFMWAAVVLYKVGASPVRVFIRFLDMVTIAVPPALPACLTIATVFSIGRLRKKSVYVTSPDRITVAGHLDVVCFDKTGTLTEQGLHLHGVLPVVQARTLELVRDAKTLKPHMQELLASCHGLARMGESLVGDPLDLRLFEATGWELVGESGSSDVSGSSPGRHPESNTTGLEEDPEYAAEVSTTMLTFVRPAANQQSSAIIRRFEFSAELQRSLVVVRSPSRGSNTQGASYLYVKGSPEMITSMVDPLSVPKDFDAVLGAYTRQGLRLLALAEGDVTEVPESELMSWNQQQFESNIVLRLVGVAIMANPLRADTADVISKLQEASLRTVMVTGDHVRTAISIAHQCSIMPEQRAIAVVDGLDAGGKSSSGAAPGHFSLSVVNVDGSVHTAGLTAAGLAGRIMAGELECAVTGKGFNALIETLHAELLPACLHRACVFARMSPDNKRDLMQLLGNGLEGAPKAPHLGLHVGFCGDGANDCGALKAAHVGVSLCEAEASVAAPMTSKHQSIASMLVVIAEGRCTLMATYQIFQFIIGYALVQGFETNMCYTYALNVGNGQFFVQDLFFTTVLAALMGFTEPRKNLSKQRPLSRVMCIPLLISTCFQLIVVVLFQCLSLWLLSSQPGYVRTDGSLFPDNPDFEVSQAPENTVLYVMALAQFVILALVFNKGKPHRSPLWTNPSLVTAIIIQSSFIVYTLFAESSFNFEVQELVSVHSIVNTGLRAKLLGLMVANAGTAVIFEWLAVGSIHVLRRLFPSIKFG